MAQQLKWQLGTVVEIRPETPSVKSLILDVPDWTTHLAGQHVDVRLKAEDGYQVRVIHTLTRRQPQNWMSYGRRIDRAMLADTAWQPAEKPLAFTCGPTAVVEAVATYLLELGYEPGRIKTERFGPTGG